ncbi:MAG: IPT/TIG domain-containing protein [Candidatus Omnitrophota bacterium]|nr:MAG: IPT/TIG domain-containing protein [Candidatus Omnitrophota bacterium]
MKKLISLVLFGLVLIGSLSLYGADDSLSFMYGGEPEEVYVDNASGSLILKSAYGERPFTIKGVNWSPATRAPQWAKGVPPIIKGVKKDLGKLDPSNTQYYGYFFDESYQNSNVSGREVLRFWLRNEIFEEYERDLYLIEEMNANTVRITANLGSSLEDDYAFREYMAVVLDKCKESHLKVIMTVVLDLEADVNGERYLKVVKAYKNHPTILMWEIANEWNIKKFYGDKDLVSAAEIVNKIAADIKSEDSSHPVCSVLADKFDTFSTVLSKCPNIDIWGVNVYRKVGIVDFLKQWQTLGTSKPVFISEFGTDSFYTESCQLKHGTAVKLADNVRGYQDEQKQADINLSLWNEIVGEEAVKSRCLGGLIHEFNDSLWKVGNPFIYDEYFDQLTDWITGVDAEARAGCYGYKLYNNDGIILGEVIDGVALNEENYGILNVEHCGVVTADRVPKLAYTAMQKEWVEAVPNTAPVLHPVDDQEVEVGQLLEFIVSGSDDIDLFTITAKMPSDITDAKFVSRPDGAAGVFSWTPKTEHAGKSYYIFFEATECNDAKKKSNTLMVKINVKDIPNTPPVLLPVTVKEIEVGKLLEIMVVGDDDDEDSFEITATMPQDITNATFVQRPGALAGLFSWTPTIAHAGKSYQVLFDAVDCKGAKSNTLMAKINVKEANKAPVFTVIAAQRYSAKACQNLNFTVAATDYDKDKITVTAKVIDAGQLVSLDTIGAELAGAHYSNSGCYYSAKFNWTPKVEHGGKEYRVVFKAEDSHGDSISKTITFEVKEALIPQIMRLNPTKGYSGKNCYLSIYGKNFGSAMMSVSTVKFAGVKTPYIRNWSDTYIRCEIPQLPGGDYEVTVVIDPLFSHMVSEPKTFTVIPSRPKIDSIKQDTSNVRRCIISGSDFGQQDEQSKVYFWSYGYGKIVNWSDKEIIFKLPEQIKKELTYRYVVHTKGGWSNYGSFYYKNKIEEQDDSLVKITHTPVEEAKKGETLYIDVGNIQSQNELPRYLYVVHSYFSKYGTKTYLRWRYVRCKSYQGRFRAEIPGRYLKPSYMQYYIVGYHPQTGYFSFDKDGMKYGRERLKKNPFWVTVSN